MTRLDQGYFTNIKGAVYFPARAYNAYQTFLDFDYRELERDFGYARKAGINSLRIFMSYDYYLTNENDFFAKFDRMLQCAERYKIRVMPVLFEDCGIEYTMESARDRNPFTAVCVRSPGKKTEQDPKLFPAVNPYLDEFMGKYKDDLRILAIEIMNEPHAANHNLEFARYIGEYVKERRGRIPLTFGCISLLHNLYFSDITDIYQFHDNFPSSVKEFAEGLEQAKIVQSIINKPCWITEWQRLRLQGPGWDKNDIPKEDKVPALSSLAQAVYNSGLGNFFWSLMLKPAYLPSQRLNGTFNGLFHEDGSVYSRDDYEAIANVSSGVDEKQIPPEWYQEELNRTRQ